MENHFLNIKKRIFTIQRSVINDTERGRDLALEMDQDHPAIHAMHLTICSIIMITWRRSIIEENCCWDEVKLLAMMWFLVPWMSLLLFLFLCYNWNFSIAQLIFAAGRWRRFRLVH